MINLTEETQKIFADRDASLAALQKKFSEDQQNLINGEGNLRLKHEAEIQEFIAGKDAALETFIKNQESGFVKLQEDALKKQDEIMQAAQVKVDALAVEFQKEVEASVKAEQAEQAAKMDKLSQEALDAEDMKGMTAEEIAADYRNAQVVAVAKHLGLSSSGKELDIAKRIEKKLAE